MHHITYRLITLLLVGAVCLPVSAFTIKIESEEGIVGEQVLSRDCIQSGESSFTSDSAGTFYTDDESYGDGQSLELNIVEGQTGFGSLGGIITFPLCTHVGGKSLVKGDEIWVRLRLKFPVGFEFNINGRNKFLRLRVFHDQDGNKISEGYNDLYLDAPPGTEPWKGYAPFQFIFEGAQDWFRMGTSEEDFFTLGKWGTVEYHIRLDDKLGSEDGNPMVRVWFNGRLLGETSERVTMIQPDSYLESLYLFTYWDNEGAHKTQKFYVDDLHITTDTPPNRDANGNPYIGVGDLLAPPNPPSLLQ